MKCQRNWVAIFGYVIMLLLFALYRVDFHTTYAHLDIYVDSVGVDSVQGTAQLWFNWAAFKWHIVLPLFAVFALFFERFAVVGVKSRSRYGRRRNWLSILTLLFMVGVIVYYYYDLNQLYSAVTEINGKFVESKNALAFFRFNYQEFPWYNWAIIALFPLMWEKWYCK